MNIEHTLSGCLHADNVYEAFEVKLESFSQRPLHSMTSLKTHTKKEIGDLFERFVQKWLLSSNRCDEAYLLKELSPAQKEKLGLLGNVDLGIDLIAISKGKWIAVQVKYVSKPKPNPYHRSSWTVNWQKLSTFYALTSRTGPEGPNSWAGHWVVTNSLGVGRRKNMPKDPKAKTFARGSFKGTPRDVWERMAGHSSYILGGDAVKASDDMREEIRRKRLQHLSQQ